MSYTFLFAARRVLNQESEYWRKFTDPHRLKNAKEIIGLDRILNEDLVKADRESDEYWKQTYISEATETGLYKSPEYVLSKMVPREKFNFLAVVVEPSEDCRKIVLDEYDFLGYELLDTSFEISVLTNCGGFDESFLKEDLNPYGLIDDHEKAYTIAKSILENNPDEYHADTNVIAVWKHKYIGRKE